MADEWPGVPPADRSQIFKPFYRVSSARERETGGAGLGLAIADRAVHLYRGSIAARNRIEGGLDVEIRLPVLPGAVDQVKAMDGVVQATGRGEVRREEPVQYLARRAPWHLPFD